MSAQHTTLASCLMPDPPDFKCSRHGPDFGISSHGPNVVVLIPQSARADRWLDQHVSYDPDCGQETWCGGGLVVQRGELPDILEAIRLDALDVETF
jgi:hypothetical protein